MRRIRSPKHASFALTTVCVFLLVLAQSTTKVFADSLWREAKAYTASIVGAYETTVQKLADAKDILEKAKVALTAARADLASAGAGATGAAATAVINAEAALATAEAGVAAASEAAVVATAAATAFLGGTGIGQGADYLIRFCWDPTCPLATADTSYVFPSDLELDAMIPDLIVNVINVPLTRADFDRADTTVPGSGTASWNYLRESVRLYAIALRGAAAFADQRCQDTLQAANDLQAALTVYTTAVTSFVSVLQTTPTFTGDPTTAISAASTKLDQLQAFVPQFTDPVAMQAAIDSARSGLNQAQLTLNDIGDGAGNPIPLDGGLFLPVTDAAFLQFLTDCDTFGVGCLPQTEVIVADRLMALLAGTFAGQPTIDDQIAQWDALGDTGNEAALFAPAGVLNVSEILTTAIGNHWSRIDTSQSPLVQECASAIPAVSGWTMIGCVGLFLIAMIYYYVRGNVSRDRTV